MTILIIFNLGVGIMYIALLARIKCYNQVCPCPARQTLASLINRKSRGYFLSIIKTCNMIQPYFWNHFCQLLKHIQVVQLTFQFFSSLQNTLLNQANFLCFFRFYILSYIPRSEYQRWVVGSPSPIVAYLNNRFINVVSQTMNGL